MSDVIVLRQVLNTSCTTSGGKTISTMISFLQEHCKWASFVVLERRANLGGTWDLNRFPGIRSDSDMYTFGFSWKMWKSPKVSLATSIRLGT